MEIKYHITEIESVARKVLEAVTHKTLLFEGEMGAGKTTFIKALVKALGSADPVSSPTFSLVNIYDSPQGPINHFDFYRIEDETEALDMGIEEYLDSGDWNLVEWPQKIADYLLDGHHSIKISTLGSSERMLNLS